MKLHEFRKALQEHRFAFPHFILPDGGHIPDHTHVTEVGHVVKNFIDCGGATGREETALLQTHVGTDTDHQLRSDRLAKILDLGSRVLPHDDLDVAVEYDCCVVAQYPIAGVRLAGSRLDIVLALSVTQCRATQRRKTKGNSCCGTTTCC
jgi:Family of unknown function (DUF6428)